MQKEEGTSYADEAGFLFRPMRLFPENMFQSSMLQALRILSCQIGDFALRSLVLIMRIDLSRH
jgi:hypothetical protein